MDDKRLLSLVRKGIEDFNLIEENDKIAVGVSGGKDSLTLLFALSKIQKFLPEHFELEAIMIDLGFSETNQERLKEVISFCADLGLNLHIVETEISNIVFNIKKEKNPCSLCANMRRGALNRKAKELGCNKVALAHSADDFVETFMLSLIYEGRLSTIQPSSYLSRSEITVIRPMIYVDEKDIIDYAVKLPILLNPCPQDKNSKRQYVKSLIATVGKDIPNVNLIMKSALLNVEEYNLLDKFRQ